MRQMIAIYGLEGRTSTDKESSRRASADSACLSQIVGLYEKFLDCHEHINNQAYEIYLLKKEVEKLKSEVNGSRQVPSNFQSCPTLNQV